MFLLAVLYYSISSDTSHLFPCFRKMYSSLFYIHPSFFITPFWRHHHVTRSCSYINSYWLTLLTSQSHRQVNWSPHDDNYRFSMTRLFFFPVPSPTTIWHITILPFFHHFCSPISSPQTAIHNSSQPPSHYSWLPGFFFFLHPIVSPVSFDKFHHHNHVS